MAELDFHTTLALLKERYDSLLDRFDVYERKLEEHFQGHVRAHDLLDGRLQAIESWRERKSAVNDYKSKQNLGTLENRKIVLAVLTLLSVSLGSSWGLIGALVWMMGR